MSNRKSAFDDAFEMNLRVLGSSKPTGADVLISTALSAWMTPFVIVGRAINDAVDPGHN